MRLSTEGNRRASRILAACAAREVRIPLSVRQPPKNPPRAADRRSRPDTELRAWAGDPFLAANVLRRRLLVSRIASPLAVDHGGSARIDRQNTRPLLHSNFGRRTLAARGRSMFAERRCSGSLAMSD